MLDGRAATQRSTGQALDLALTGEGFFEVATDDGPAYTRQGDFRIDARGRLVTAGGQPLVGKGGAELRLATSTPVIDAAGNITEPNAAHGAALPAGQLKVVRFESLAGMRHLGQGLLSAGVNGSVMADADIRLRQGALENSGVDSMQEMVALMQTMRHAESMQRLAQGYDELMGTAIHKLGDLS
jgi:flagellar basal-body rod protein FlgG